MQDFLQTEKFEIKPQLFRQFERVNDEKRRKMLVRTLDDSTGEGKNICNDHLLALTEKLKVPPKCLAEYPEDERKLPTKDLKNARTVAPEYSKHIYQSTHGFIFPSGALL